MTEIRERIAVPHCVFLSPWGGKEALSLERATALLDADGGTSVATEIVPTAADEIWWRYKWIRAHAFMEAVHAQQVQPHVERLATPRQLDDTFDRKAVFGRRSCRFFKKVVVTREMLESALDFARSLLAELWYLTLYLAVERIEGLEVGVYQLTCESGFAAMRSGLDRKLLLGTAQGQNWAVTGAGGAFFIGVDWTELRSRFGDGPEGYMELLFDLGRFGQGLLLALYQSGLGAGVTPAIDETKAKALAGLDNPNQELLYLIKFGVPREVEWS